MLSLSLIRFTTVKSNRPITGKLPHITTAHAVLTLSIKKNLLYNKPQTHRHV